MHRVTNFKTIYERMNFPMSKFDCAKCSIAILSCSLSIESFSNRGSVFEAATGPRNFLGGVGRVSFEIGKHTPS